MKLYYCGGRDDERGMISAALLDFLRENNGTVILANGPKTNAKAIMAFKSDDAEQVTMHRLSGLFVAPFYMNPENTVHFPLDLTKLTNVGVLKTIQLWYRENEMPSCIDYNYYDLDSLEVKHPDEYL